MYPCDTLTFTVIWSKIEGTRSQCVSVKVTNCHSRLQLGNCIESEMVWLCTCPPSIRPSVIRPSDPKYTFVYWNTAIICPEGAWKVSEGSLEGVCRCLKIFWKVSGRFWRLSVGCLEYVWNMSGECLEGVWMIFGRCLDDVWKVSGWCLEGVWMMSGRCLVGV